MPDYVILTPDRDLAQAMALELSAPRADGSLPAVAVSSDPADLPAAAVTFLDADAFLDTGPVPGLPVYFGRALADSLPGESPARLHRPFALSALAAFVSGAPAPRGLSYPAGRTTPLLDGRPLALSPRENALLFALYEADGAPVCRETLLARVFGEGADPGVLPVYICHLRRKLEGDGRRMLRAVRGRGYALLKGGDDR